MELKRLELDSFLESFIIKIDDCEYQLKLMSLNIGGIGATEVELTLKGYQIHFNDKYQKQDFDLGV